VEKKKKRETAWERSKKGKIKGKRRMMKSGSWWLGCEDEKKQEDKEDGREGGRR